MSRIPGARGVDQSLQSVRTAVKQALRGLNQAAAQQMGKGNYAVAEGLVSRGREIQQFHEQVESLRKRWREVRRGRDGSIEKKPKTAQWAYYQPILKALAEAGGAAGRVELEPSVARLMSGALQPGDHEPLGRGTERWQVLIRRARKHLAAEGWIEAGPNRTWRITEAGRRAASKPLGPPKGTGT
jgi:hypothetical protein